MTTNKLELLTWWWRFEEMRHPQSDFNSSQGEDEADFHPSISLKPHTLASWWLQTKSPEMMTWMNVLLSVHSTHQSSQHALLLLCRDLSFLYEENIRIESCGVLICVNLSLWLFFLIVMKIGIPFSPLSPLVQKQFILQGAAWSDVSLKSLTVGEKSCSLTATTVKHWW